MFACSPSGDYFWARGGQTLLFLQLQYLILDCNCTATTATTSSTACKTFEFLAQTKSYSSNEKNEAKSTISAQQLLRGAPSASQLVSQSVTKFSQPHTLAPSGGSLD